MSPLVNCDATNEGLVTQKLSGSASANEVASIKNSINTENIIHLPDERGVKYHSGSKPIGPVAAPIMLPNNTVEEISRSFFRKIRGVTIPPMVPQSTTQATTGQKKCGCSNAADPFS